MQHNTSPSQSSSHPSSQVPSTNTLHEDEKIDLDLDMDDTLKIELEKDNYKVSNPILEFDSSGNLNIYPNATL